MEDIEYSIQSQKQHVVSCNVLDILEFVYHEQLRQDSEGLQPDAVAPQDIDRRK